MTNHREPQIWFRIPFTLYWIGRLPYECCKHKYFALFKKEFGSTGYKWVEIGKSYDKS